jgi:hypothetical protein
MSDGKWVCGNCIWFSSGSVYGDGECRRNTPRLKLSRHSDEVGAAWPVVESDAWCGEHRPQPQREMALEG